MRTNGSGRKGSLEEGRGVVRIAAPMACGILAPFLLELLVHPSVYQIWKWNFELKKELAALEK
jgi:hypothetical protein